MSLNQGPLILELLLLHLLQLLLVPPGQPPAVLSVLRVNVR